MKYDISEILSITSTHLLNPNSIPAEIAYIYFDTRRGIYGDNGLFVAIDGKNSDGHSYIQDAYHNYGTRNFLVSKAIDIRPYPDSNFIFSEDVINTLQALATYHRSQYPLRTIAITGSNGKTMIKEWIYQLCASHYSIVRSPASYNSQLGVPLSVLRIDKKHDLGIFEAGISKRNEMELLEHIILPDWGVFTNIGEAHSAGFSDMEEKLKEKLNLFKNCKKIIYCADEVNLRNYFDNDAQSLIAWSCEDKNAAYFVHFDKETITINDRKFPIKFQDIISKTNATFAIIVALELGIEEVCSQELDTLRMRLEMKQGINNCFLINDTYNSDFNALSSALHILDQQQKRRHNTLILSQLEESNLSSAVLYARITELLEKSNVHRLITIGNQLKDLPFRGTLQHYDDTAALLDDFSQLAFHNENILLKGARKFNLEKIFEKLSIKVHQTILHIDLEAMRHNLQVFRSYLNPETKLMVVLKASGYGSGSKELSRFLAYQRVDYIAVAYIDEGIELRKAGIELPIMVMNPEESGFNKMIEFNLEPEIYSIKQLLTYCTYLKEGRYPIHLKLETGMHRLGIEKSNIGELISILKNEKNIHIQSIFSHLVASDDPNLDSFSRSQIDQFEKMYTMITESLQITPDRHILNSNGISRFPKYQYEMVRLGIGLHGISDDPKINRHLRKVQTLKTRIAQIKTIEKGESIGYNRKCIAEERMTIGTINIGYADGLPRNAGNDRYSVSIRGQEAYIKGNICMDMCMIHLDNVEANEGDEVIVFGPEWPIEKLARACDTIPYEILTRLSNRIHRIFSRE